MARFLIVAPTFQAEPWLDEALGSILGQAGGHAIRLHVQDGGSTDGTLDIVERWRARVSSEPRIDLSVDSGPDGGLYDAVARGFEALGPEPGDLMTWLNADDLLAPGALSAVATCLAELPTVSLCGGRVSMIDHLGRVVRVNAPVALSRKLLAAGLHDGRRMPFVMQEGTFWRQELWTQVGGVNPSFRLAGDWDLWRRMARHAEFVTLDVLTAFHRRRPGQLSENLDAYHAELDRALTGEAREAYDRTWADYVAAGSTSRGQAFAGFEGPVAHLDRETLKWSLTHRFGERLEPPVEVSSAGRAAARRGGVISGARGFEGPYPEWDLPAGVRWITERQAGLSVPADGPGLHAVRLTCRPGVADLSVTIRAGEEVVHHAVLDPETPPRDQVLAFDLWTADEEAVLELETTTPHGDPENRLLVIDLTVQPKELPPDVRAQVAGPSVVVEAAGPQGLGATLASLAGQGAAAVARVQAVDPVMAVVLDAWRGVVARVEVATEPAEPAGAARIAGGARLAPGALAGLIAVGSTERGASLEPDGRGGFWLRPSTEVEPVTDQVLTAAPSAPRGPRPRILRLVESGHGSDDALGRMLRLMDAEVRVRAAGPGSAGGDWTPDLVIGPAEALDGVAPVAARLAEDAELLGLAEEAEAALALFPRPRLVARAVFGLEAATTVWAVDARDAAKAMPAAESQGVVLLVVGETNPRRATGGRLVSAGTVEDPELLSWLLSAADALAATPATPEPLRRAARACGLGERALDGSPPAPIRDAQIARFARAMLARAGEEGARQDGPLRRALRFRRRTAGPTRLMPGAGARPSEAGVEVAGSGTLYLMAPASGAVKLRLTASGKTSAPVRLTTTDRTQELSLRDEAVATVAVEAGRPLAIRVEGGSARRPIRVALAEVPAAGQDDAPKAAAPWEPRDGFGGQEPPAPELGLHAPFRWIEARRARLAVLNDTAGWKRLTLGLRSLMKDQRVMIRAGGRIVAEAETSGGDIRAVGTVAAVARLPKGWTEIDLIFSSVAVTPDRSLAAIIDHVTLADAKPVAAVTGAGWTDVDGFDFEEPPAPQFGLTTAFRWRLPGSRIAVRGERPGPHRVTIRYRTALAGQVLTASRGGTELARHAATHGRLDTDEILTFEVALPAAPLDIALDADRYMDGERSLGFIIQSVIVEPTL